MRLRVKLNYILSIFLGLIMGILAVLSMVSQSIGQIVLIILICIGLFAAVVHIRKFDKKLRTVLLLAVCFLTGYLLCCALVSGFAGKIKTEDIAPAERKEDTAVLLLSPGEIEECDRKSIIYRLNSYKEAGFGGIRWWNMPLKAQQYKRGFNRTDKEAYIKSSQELCNKLEGQLGNGFVLYNASLFGPPYVETVINEILQLGYGKIIILNDLLVELPYKDMLQKRIFDVIQQSEMDVEVMFTFPLWNHDGLVSHYEQQILERTQEISPEQVGVVLVARNFDKKAQRQHPQAADRAEVFYNKIKESIVKNGYDGRKIRIAYLDHRHSGIKDTIDYLLDYGINKLVVVMAGFESHCIETEYIIPSIVEGRKMPDNVNTVLIGPWGDSEFLVDALVDRLDMVEQQ